MAKTRKSGLGKGLDSLIPSGLEEEAKEISRQEKKSEAAPDAYVQISLIEPNRRQPRKDFDEASLAELAESIRRNGVIEPLIVRRKDDHYEIAAGERRWRAAKMADLQEVPVLIRDYDDARMSEIALLENLQRKDLNPIEEAAAFKTLMDEYGMTQADVAERVSMSRSAVTNSLRLLNLNPDVQKLVADGTLSVGHAKVLMSLPRAEQFKAAKQVAEQELNVRETEQLVKNLQKDKKEPEKKRELSNDFAYRDLETRMKDRIGTKVQIKRKNEKAGKIEIEYYSTDDLERISELLGL